MSRRPGIGAGMIWDVASVLLDLHTSQTDVPVSLRHGGQEFPLGRYLRRLLRERIGRDPGCPDEKLQEIVEQTMRPLQITARSHPRGLKGAIEDAFAGKIARTESRYKIFKKKRTL